MSRTVVAPIALALTLALGACGASGTDANVAAANETVLNDADAEAGLLTNDEAANLVDDSATANDAAVSNDSLAAGTGNAL